MRIVMNGRTEQYSGAVEINFQPNENATLHLTDGRTADLFADGTWQVWAPGKTDPPTAPELIGQGSFHALPDTPAVGE